MKIPNSESSKNSAESILQESSRNLMMQRRRPNEKQTELKQRALSSPFIFSDEVLGYRKLIARLHGMWAGAITASFDPKRPAGYRALFQAFRGSYKSSFLSVGLPLWALAHNPDLRILILGESSTNAEDFVREQQSHILRNATFIRLFGEWYLKDEFRDTDYIVATRKRVIGKESSVTAAGLDSTLVGGHYDLIIADDLVGSDDRDSPAKRRATLKFYQDMFSLLEDHGVLIVVGTRWHRDDLYHHISMKQNVELKAQHLRTFDTFFHPAVLEDGETPAYPEILDKRALQTLRVSKGIVEFSAQYLLEPMSEEDMIFKTLHWFDMATISEEVLSKARRIAYCDYAGGRNQDKGDFSAIITLLEVSKTELLCIDADVKRRPVSETNARLIFNHKIMPYNEVGVETDIFEMISKDLTDQCTTEKVQLNVKRRPSRSLPNKTARINSIEGRVSAGVIKFRKDWKSAPNNYHLLIEQLQSFGIKQEHDDAPDALEGAVWLALGGGDPKFWHMGEKKSQDEQTEADKEQRKKEWEARNMRIISGADEGD